MGITDSIPNNIFRKKLRRHLKDFRIDDGESQTKIIRKKIAFLTYKPEEYISKGPRCKHKIRYYIRGIHDNLV